MSRLLLSVLCVVLGCGQSDQTPQVIHIPLSSPQSLDPALVDRVEVAAIRDSDKRCVSTDGSNVCSDFPSVVAATQAGGFVDRLTLKQSTGSTASFSDLPQGKICFVAEALSATDQQLASGCADVELKLDRHKIEIVIE